MDARFPGMYIRIERLKKGWSQEGLCKGICSVSYLSKIEHGKAQTGDDVLQLLFSRLGITWQDETGQANLHLNLVDQIYDALFSMETDTAQKLLTQTAGEQPSCLQGPYMLDFLLLETACNNTIPDEALSIYAPVMDERQYGLWLCLKGNFEDLLKIQPTPYYLVIAGINAYNNGKYSLAIERLQKGYDSAAQQGAVSVMLHAKVIIGNCYSNLAQYEQMLQHYNVASRLARALGNQKLLGEIEYNIASTKLELGLVDEAYAYFHAIETPKLMSCHKLAICCELLGRTREAAQALEMAQNAPCNYPDRDLALQMCDLVGYRLAHPDYIKKAQYGQMLLSCFDRIYRQLPRGYAIFHLRWIKEWYQASRQYKQLYELLETFPDKIH